jgi:hypothetical protein
LDAAVRLDLPTNPGKYLAARATLDGNGQLIVEVGNPTRVPVADVLVTVRYADAQGAVREQSRQLTGKLPPGQALRQAAGLGPFASTATFEVTVAAARVLETP